MGIKSEFYLSVSFDMLRDVISHIIPEGEFVDEKVKLGPVDANIWATRTGPFTTYVKDQAIYLAAPFHVNLKFPNFFAHLAAGEQILEFTLTIKCSVITTENLKITLNLDIFDIDWKAKPALHGGITVTGHVEPRFRNWFNPKLQEVVALINKNLSFQTEVSSGLQKIQTPIKLQYKKEIARYHKEGFTVSAIDLEKLDRVLNKLLGKVSPAANLFSSDRAESMYISRFFNFMSNASITPAIASVDIPRLGF